MWYKVHITGATSVSMVLQGSVRLFKIDGVKTTAPFLLCSLPAPCPVRARQGSSGKRASRGNISVVSRTPDKNDSRSMYRACKTRSTLLLRRSLLRSWMIRVTSRSRNNQLSCSPPRLLITPPTEFWWFSICRGTEARGFWDTLSFSGRCASERDAGNRAPGCKPIFVCSASGKVSKTRGRVPAFDQPRGS